MASVKIFDIRGRLLVERKALMRLKQEFKRD